MNDPAVDEGTQDLAFDIVAMRRGFVGGIVGIDDWDLSRTREAREIVIFDFGGREQAHAGIAPFKRTTDMRLGNALVHLAPGCVITLGTGEAPPANAAYPHMIRVLAPNGFRHGNVRTFECACEIVERGAWHETPPLRRVGKTATSADRVDEEDEDAGDAAEAGRAGRLGSAPRLEPEQGRKYSEPMFRIPVVGFTRTLRQGSWGRDEHGNPTYMSTHVRPSTRYKDKPERMAP